MDKKHQTQCYKLSNLVLVYNRQNATRTSEKQQKLWQELKQEKAL